MLERLRHPAVWLPVSFLLLAIVVWRSRLWEAGAVLRAVDPGLVLVALLVGQLTPILWAVRSRDLLAATGHPVGVLALLPMTSLANTINNLTPGSAGELVRLYLLRVRHAVDYATSGAVILVERFGAIGYLSASALLVWAAWIGAWPPFAAVVALGVLVIAPGLLYAAGFRPLRIAGRMPGGRFAGDERWSRWAASLGRVDDTIAILLGHPGRLAAFAAATGGVFGVATLQLVLVARAAGVGLDPTAAWGALGLSITAGVLSLLPFGLGAADLALVTLLGVAGAPPAQAAVIAFGYRLVSTLPYAIEGVLAYAWLSARLPAGSVRRAAAGHVPREQGGLGVGPLDGAP